MKLRHKIYLVVATLAGVFLWGRCSRPPAKRAPSRGPKPAAVLPKNDNEQIIVNPETHTISVVTKTGTKTETLPDRASTVDIETNGQVKVTAPQFGLEAHPFIGVGAGQGVRLYGGCDFGYIKKFDLGLGLVSPKMFVQNADLTDMRLGLFASYGVWSNSRISLGVDNQKAIHVLISVRL